MYKLLPLCLCLSILIGCNQKPDNSINHTPNAVEHQASNALLNDISGVWNEGNDLVTIYYDGVAIHFIVNDEAKATRLGDIDTENETINIILTKVDDSTDGILTIRRHWNEAHTEYTLMYTHFDGTNGELGFVRRIGSDDKNRIENLYTQQANAQFDYSEDPSTPAYSVEDYNYNQEEVDYIEADRQATDKYNAEQAAIAEAAAVATSAAEEAIAAAENYDY